MDNDIVLFIVGAIAAAVVPMVLGIFATKQFGTVPGSLLVGFVLGGALAWWIDPLLGVYGLFAWFMAALPGDRWWLLHRIGDAMSADRRRRR